MCNQLAFTLYNLSSWIAWSDVSFIQSCLIYVHQCSGHSSSCNKLVPLLMIAYSLPWHSLATQTRPVYTQSVQVCFDDESPLPFPALHSSQHQGGVINMCLNAWLFQNCQPDERLPDEWPRCGPPETVHHCGTLAHEENPSSPTAESGEEGGEAWGKESMSEKA